MQRFWNRRLIPVSAVPVVVAASLLFAVVVERAVERPLRAAFKAQRRAGGGPTKTNRLSLPSLC